MVNLADKSAYPLFGDAGTVTAFEYKEGASDIHFSMSTDGAGYESIIIPDGGRRNRTSLSSLELEEIEEGIKRTKLDVVLNGMDIFAFGISKVPKSINEMIEYFSLEKDKIDFFLFHQANLFMNEKIRKKINVSKEKVPYSLANFGNTSSASIPLTMVSELSSELKMRKLHLFSCGFGVGLSWGSVYLETENIVCSSLVEL
jgi:3-oxoacyl-[acyl-carrier-protein] synthase-3